jgi:hypothetical protein
MRHKQYGTFAGTVRSEYGEQSGEEHGAWFPFPKILLGDGSQAVFHCPDRDLFA